MADNLAQGLVANNLKWLKSLLPRMAAVTPADIQRVAKKYLDPQKRVVVWSVPKEENEKSSAAGLGGGKGLNAHGTAAFRSFPRDSTSAGGGAGEFSLKDAKRFVLPNGLTLLLWENHRLPIVVADGAHCAGRAPRTGRQNRFGRTRGRAAR